MTMTPAQIAQYKQGDPFVFDYFYTNPIQVFIFDSADWGVYKADSSIAVGDTITPGMDDTGKSVAGSWTASVSLGDLSGYTVAHINWEGSGFTAQYTLDGGTTWTALSEDGVVSLSAGVDFDIKISFAGGAVGDTSNLTTLTVYVFNTEELNSLAGLRTLTFSADPITPAGLVIDADVTVSAVDTSASLESGAPAPTGSTNPNMGTVEALVTLTSGSTVFTGLTGTTYVNGVVGTPSAGAEQHVVVVLTTPANTSFQVGPNCTIRHLAVYQAQLSAGDVENLYESQVNGIPTFRVDDAATITVTEHNPAVDIYAYTWSVISGGTQ